MTFIEAIGWAAALATFLAHCMKTMLPLRVLAICSNLLFIAYGSLAAAQPILVLHVALLPFNLYRLYELRRSTLQMRRAVTESGLPPGIQSYLQPHEVAPDEVLFRKDDPADRIFYLKSGRILLEEIGEIMEAGEIFGELAFFSEERRRTLTARCIGPCEILSMRESDFTRLYYQEPSFAFFVLRLLARRLESNTRRIRA
jgi:hypothetical protein